jgi:hypothetical protein
MASLKAKLYQQTCCTPYSASDLSHEQYHGRDDRHCEGSVRNTSVCYYLTVTVGNCCLCSDLRSDGSAPATHALQNLREHDSGRGGAWSTRIQHHGHTPATCSVQGHCEKQECSQEADA